MNFEKEIVSRGIEYRRVSCDGEIRFAKNLAVECQFEVVQYTNANIYAFIALDLKEHHAESLETLLSFDHSDNVVLEGVASTGENVRSGRNSLLVHINHTQSMTDGFSITYILLMSELHIRNAEIDENTNRSRLQVSFPLIIAFPINMRPTG